MASAVIGLAALAAAASLVVRFRRAHGVERQQLRWLALAVTTVVPVGVLIAVLTGSAWGTGIAVLSVQLAIYAAIVRYRLYDLDRIIHPLTRRATAHSIVGRNTRCSACSKSRPRPPPTPTGTRPLQAVIEALSILACARDRQR